jgi:hypothetical protein
MKITPNSKLEYIIVIAIFTAVIIPSRLLVIYLFNDNWIGTIGVLTAVTAAILGLAHKGKLGKFGPMYIRFLNRLHRGRHSKYVYIMSGLFFVIAGSQIFFIHAGNNFWLTDYVVDQIKTTSTLPNASLYDQILNSQFNIVLPVGHTPTEYEMLITMLAVVDRVNHGWYLYGWMVMFVEQIEVFTLLMITKVYTARMMK